MKGYAAYARVQPTNDSYRDLEYKVLGQVTGALIEASAEGSQLSERYDAALWKNIAAGESSVVTTKKITTGENARKV